MNMDCFASLEMTILLENLMFREMLKAKIHRATVTGSNIDYEGSIMVDENLLKVANILPYEKVLVINLQNGSRVETYAIVGRAGSGEVSVNGGAALFSKVGDKIIIMNFCLLDERELKNYQAKVIRVDEKNHPIP